MRHHSSIRFSVPFACLGMFMFILLTGCSGQQVTSSAEEETLVPGPEMAEPVEEFFEPEPFEPEPVFEEIFEPELMVEEAFEPEPMVEETFEPELMVEEAFEPEPMVEETFEPEPMIEEAFEPEPMIEEAFEPEPMFEETFEPEPMVEEAFVPEPEPEPVIEVVEPEPLPEPTPEPLALEDVYFDFDESSLRYDAREALEANARSLQENDGWTLRVEGHCDERGTSAYNMVLGERRAGAVKRYLKNLGVPGFKIDIVSYGKEKPFCSGHDEYCWQENRRAHFVY